MILVLVCRASLSINRATLYLPRYTGVKFTAEKKRAFLQSALTEQQPLWLRIKTPFRSQKAK
jgi:hypothetical protein